LNRRRDDLVNGFQDWSWANRNLSNTFPINSGSNSISVASAAWTALLFQHSDYPANDHGSGAGMAFSDGHSEPHKWMDVFLGLLPESVLNQNGGQGAIQVSTCNLPALPQDLAWIQLLTSVPK
jgi:prepilin-type processing-associated H-X9-DG protein